MAVGRIHGGLNNQEGMSIPHTSSWGQALVTHLSRLFDDPMPIGGRTHGRKPWRGNVGAVATVAANTRSLTTQPGYFGDVPLSEQATVQAPPPWQRL